MMPLNMILHYTYIFYSNHQNMQNLRDCTVPNDVSLIDVVTRPEKPQNI